MKACLSVSALLVAGLLASRAAASIPPPAWQPTVWDGPGLACATSFGVELVKGETLTKGYPSVGRIAYTVATPKGPVEIVEFWQAAAPAPGPETEDRPNGRLSPVAEPSGLYNGTVAEYVFVPGREGPLPITVHFRAGDGARSAWTGRDYDAVLKRITFGVPDLKRCKAATQQSPVTAPPMKN